MVSDYEVVLPTFNGEKFLLSQLDSIGNQSLSPARIIISDDGSSDSTLNIIHQWSMSNHIPVTLLPNDGNRLGSCRNFEKLLAYSSADYVMLADQDDIWDLNKAEDLIHILNQNEKIYGSNIPILVHSDLRIVNELDQIIAYSFFQFQHLNPIADDWLSISLQNVVTGCSCVVNRACIDKCLPFCSETILHDWWLALVTSKFGKIIYTPTCYVSYRQHSNNVVGATGFKNMIIKRITKLYRDSSIDSWIGPGLYQLHSFNRRYESDGSVTSKLISDLISRNSFARINAALKLRLSKHGKIRTLVFYIILFLWHPRQEYK